MRMKNLKKPKYLGKNTKLNQDNPDKFVLDPIDNPHPDKDYSIRFSSPEFTSICPITSQPDFANIIIDYIPNKLLLESKSLKLFLFSFRNYGGFHEDCTIKIAKKIIHYVKPKWIRIVSVWNPRGGIPIDVFFEEGIVPKKVHVQDLNMNVYKPR